MTQLSISVDVIGHGQPLVFLHGWGWNSEIWQPLIPQLVKNYQVFLIDLPGFGKSPLLTNDYTFEALVPEILAKTPPNAAWVGWSLGGLFSLWIAIHFPERVSHLITIASSPRFVRDTNWPGVELATLEKFSNLLMVDYKKTLRDFLELQLRGSPQKEELFSLLEKKIFISNETSLKALLGGLILLRETDLREELKGLHCPSLHIFGQLDTIVPMRIANLLNPMLPNANFEIVNRTGHMPFLSHQEHFITLLNQFLHQR